jgi:hypothetical protein
LVRGGGRKGERDVGRQKRDAYEQIEESHVKI